MLIDYSNGKSASNVPAKLAWWRGQAALFGVKYIPDWWAAIKAYAQGW